MQAIGVIFLRDEQLVILLGSLCNEYGYIIKSIENMRKLVCFGAKALSI